MRYVSHWIESIIYPELPSGELLVELGAGDKEGAARVIEIEKFLSTEFNSAEYDGHTYYFSEDTDEAEINAWVEEKWPDRVVRFTNAGGIEFDYENEGEEENV